VQASTFADNYFPVDVVSGSRVRSYLATRADSAAAVRWSAALRYSKYRADRTDSGLDNLAPAPVQRGSTPPSSTSNIISACSKVLHHDKTSDLTSATAIESTTRDTGMALRSKYKEVIQLTDSSSDKLIPSFLPCDCMYSTHSLTSKFCPTVRQSHFAS